MNEYLDYRHISAEIISAPRTNELYIDFLPFAPIIKNLRIIILALLMGAGLCFMGSMDLLPDTYNWALRMRWECRERFPRHRLQRKPIVSDPAMHHGTCVIHVPWCMSVKLVLVGKTAIPVHAQPAFLRIWLEAHKTDCSDAECYYISSFMYLT